MPQPESDESFESADEDFDDGREDEEEPVIKKFDSTSTSRRERAQKEAMADCTRRTDSPIILAEECDGDFAEAHNKEDREEQGPKVEKADLQFHNELRDNGPALRSPWLSSFLKSASDTVVNLKTSVAESARLVIESVDTKLGAPDPKDLALQIKQLKIREEQEKAVLDDTDDGQITTDNGEDSHHVHKLTNFWKTPRFTTFVSTGLDALENVGRKTIDVLRTDRLESVASKIVGPKSNEDTAGKSLSMLVSQGRMADTIPKNDVKTNTEMDSLKKSAMKAEERIQTECVRDAFVVAEVKRMKREMEIAEDEKDSHCVNFSEAVNEFEQAMQSAPWSLTLDWNFVSKILAEVEVDLGSVVYGHSSISDIEDKCTASISKVHDASVQLFTLLSKNCASASSAKSVAVSLLHISTACVQHFARLIKEQSAVSDKQRLSDVMSQIFFKESDASAEIEEAYSFLQPCVIAHMIVNRQKLD